MLLEVKPHILGFEILYDSSFELLTNWMHIELMKPTSDYTHIANAIQMKTNRLIENERVMFEMNTGIKYFEIKVVRETTRNQLSLLAANALPKAEDKKMWQISVMLSGAEESTADIGRDHVLTNNARVNEIFEEVNIDIITKEVICMRERARGF